ncbi:cylicin-1-like [Cylas formicarius]|uniref:cylicin-1-like n=1 Tax=Cylas formicarius TaxID=197179 RepID=UPI00295834A8|nr:cylicin-1-like [Cylas formicarius]
MLKLVCIAALVVTWSTSGVVSKSSTAIAQGDSSSDAPSVKSVPLRPPSHHTSQDRKRDDIKVDTTKLDKEEKSKARKEDKKSPKEEKDKDSHHRLEHDTHRDSKNGRKIQHGEEKGKEGEKSDRAEEEHVKVAQSRANDKRTNKEEKKNRSKSERRGEH